MDEATKRKFNANIKAVNGDLIGVLENPLPNEELIKLSFDAIRILIDECEKFALKENAEKKAIEAQIAELQEKLKNLSNHKKCTSKNQRKCIFLCYCISLKFYQKIQQSF